MFCGYRVLVSSRKPFCQILFSVKISELKLLFVRGAFASDIACFIFAPPTSDIIKRALGYCSSGVEFIFFHSSFLTRFFSNDNFSSHVNIREIINKRQQWSVNIKCYLLLSFKLSILYYVSHSVKIISCFG